MLIVLAVFFAGCAKGPVEPALKQTVDTTDQSISQLGATDSALDDQETDNVSSDMDQVIDTLG